MKLKSVILTLLLVISNLTFAQKKTESFKMSGAVVDQVTGKALIKVTVLVSSRIDSKELTGTTTDEKGYFSINNISERLVRLKLSMVGYQTQVVDSIDLDETPRIGLIKLMQAPIVMPEVVVRSLKPMIELQVDKQVINMDRVPGGNGTVTDALKNSGAVDVDPQTNNITVRGQSVKLQMDGHDLQMTQDMLAQMPAEMIDQAEVILSPGAKESAEGGAYILNLISKKNTLDNINGSVGLGTSTNSSNNGSLNLNYKANKINVFGSFFGWLGPNKYSSSSEHTNFNSANLFYQSTAGEGNNTFANGSGKLGFDYNYDDNNIFTFYSSYSRYKMNFDGLYNNSVKNILGIPQYSYDGTSKSNYSSENFSLSGFYKKKFEGKDHELTVDMYYNNMWNPSGSEMNQSYSYKPGYPDMQNTSTDVNARAFVFKSNFTIPLFTGNVETGYNFTARKRENAYNSLNYSYLQNDWQDSMKLSNTFDYKENIHALYLTFSRKLDKFELKTGLRMEDLFTNGVQLTTNEYFSKDYLNLFPNFILSYKFNNMFQLVFNTFRRVTYPQLYFVNPFKTYNGPNSYSMGNPQVQPSFLSSYGLSLSQYINVYFVNSTGMITGASSVVQDSITMYSYINVTSNKTYGADLTLPYNNSPMSPFQLPEFINSFRIQFSYRYRSQVAQFLNENLTYIDKTLSMNSQLSLKLWYDINGGLYLSYYPGSNNIKSKSNDHTYLSINFSKTFMDQKIRVNLSASNLLNANTYVNETFGSNFYSRSNYMIQNSRVLSISLTYMFNNYKERYDRNLDDGRDANGNSGVQ